MGAVWQSGGGRSSYTCLMLSEDGGMAVELSEGPSDRDNLAEGQGVNHSRGEARWEWGGWR